MSGGALKLLLLLFGQGFVLRRGSQEGLPYPLGLVRALGTCQKLFHLCGQEKGLGLVFSLGVWALDFLGGAVFNLAAVPVEPQNRKEVLAVDER